MWPNEVSDGDEPPLPRMVGGRISSGFPSEKRIPKRAQYPAVKQRSRIRDEKLPDETKPINGHNTAGEMNGVSGRQEIYQHNVRVEKNHECRIAHHSAVTNCAVCLSTENGVNYDAGEYGQKIKSFVALHGVLAA